MLVLKSFVTLALPLFVIANPLVQVRNDPPTTCNSGKVDNCCKSTMNSTEPLVGGILGLLGLLGLDGSGGPLVGLNCLFENCGQQTICCTGNNFGPSGTSSGGGSIISIGCSPITVNL